MPYSEKRWNLGQNDHKTKNQDAPRTSSAFFEVVKIVHPELSLFMRPKDACSLLLACSRHLQQNIRDVIATEALLYYCTTSLIAFTLEKSA
ncbi:hypothetical protein GN958_ATG13992 [Phytophthora infestans]|uniref:Uncharacterized protein n=1 Tax=Phytophthora infestans TaxID=4787 RepID=A0A8S9U915_PHYIN|nr:hypothetical protein GN958_ATG13992 [Phytophthora infestans]